MFKEDWTIKFQGKPVDYQTQRASSEEELDEMYNGMCKIFQGFTIERKNAKKEGPREKRYSLNIPTVGMFDQVQVFNSESEFAMFCLEMRRKGMQIR
jgi:hypothetical protein